MNHYYKDKDKLIEWGGCSSRHLPITDSKGNLAGHIVHQESHLKNYVDLINLNQDVEVIDISQLNKFTNIHENSKVYEKNDDNVYNFDTLLKDLKKATIYPKKDVMINKQISRIINHIYAYDIEFIDSIKRKFNSKKKSENSENS